MGQSCCHHNHAPAAHSVACYACNSTNNTYECKKDGYSVFRCKDCLTVFIDPMPTAEQLNEYYSAYRSDSNYFERKRDKKIKRSKGHIERILKFAPNAKTFLDVGCNYGFAVEAAHQAGLKASGIDIDAESVATAAKRFPNGDFHSGYIEEFAKQGRQFDVIYSSEVIEHTPTPHEFAKAVYDLTAPGGVFYVTTPWSDHWSVPKDLLKWSSVIPPEHITLFSSKALAQTLENAGFKIIKRFFNLKPGLRFIVQKEK